MALHELTAPAEHSLHQPQSSVCWSDACRSIPDSEISDHTRQLLQSSDCMVYAGSLQLHKRTQEHVGPELDIALPHVSHQPVFVADHGCSMCMMAHQPG